MKIGGVWYVDPSDAVLRQGVYVQADINPTAGPLFVAYPEATAACAQPEVVAPEAGSPGGHGASSLCVARQRGAPTTQSAVCWLEAPKVYAAW